MTRNTQYFLERLVVGPIMINCYIFGCQKTKQAVIIDPGDEAERIIEAVDNLNAHVEKILLTHGHYDHLGAVEDIKKKYDCPIAIHTAEEDALTQPTVNLSLFTGGQLVCPPADILLQEGATIQVGELTLTVLHTPGHSIGSICFKYDKLVFDGDLLFYGSIGRTDLPNGDFKIIEKSIKEKIYTLPDDTIIYPGHGEKTTVGFEKQSNAFVRMS